MPTLQESRTPELHKQHSYKLLPPRPVGCELIWSINGQNVTVGSSVGGLSVKGIGASGEMTVEVEDDIDNTEVTATLICPGLAPAVVGPMPVGSGVWPPVAAPPGPPGINLAPLMVAMNTWSWWDRFFGVCPKTVTIGNAQCQCNIAPEYEGPWPFYYKVKCTFNCPLRVIVLTWTLSFGVILEGPN